MRKHINDITRISSYELYELLKDDIISLKYKPGEMISENELANKYNVSRTLIRSVFSKLKSDKLLEVFPQKGSFVTMLNMEEIRNIIYIRVQVENDILQEVIENCNDSVILKLQENLDQQKRIIEEKEVNLFKFLEAETAFHEIYYDFVGRRSLWFLIRDLQNTYTRFRILSLLIFRNYNDLYLEHINIFNTIKNRNIEEMKNTIKEHLNYRNISFENYKIYFNNL